LGVVYVVTTKRPTPSRAGPFGRGADSAARLLGIPLMLLGVVGVVLWILDRV
jgi:hypothetical protein